MMNNKSIKVHVISERCKGCGLCIEVCQPGVLEFSEAKNSSDYYYPLVVNGDACLNCGLCEMYCPDFAVWVTIITEEAGA